MSLKLIGVVVYLLVLIGIGVAASRRMRSLRDFYVGGKQMGFWAVAFSARATGESAWLLIGLTGMGAAVGLPAMWVVLGEILGVGGAWLLLSRRFKRLTDRYDSVTVPDYIESRFKDHTHGLRIVSAIALVVFVTIYVSAQIDATGKAFEDFLNWNYYVGAVIGFLIVGVYITTGGFVAVVWSDVFQGTMMCLGLVLLPILGLIKAGGWEQVSQGLQAQSPALLSLAPVGAYPLLLILNYVLIGIGFLGSPQIFVRFIALRDEREISRGAAVAIAWTLLADVGAVLTGMIGRHLLMGPGDDVTAVLSSDGEDVLPMMVDVLITPILIGVFIAIVLAAIMSTVDSLLVVASSALVRDYYQKVRNPDLPDEALVALSRKATAVLALLALIIALAVAYFTPSRTVFWFVIFGWSGIAATFCPTMILSLFWRGMTARGAMAAMTCGFAAVPIFEFAVPEIPSIGPAIATLGELAPSFAIGMIVGVGVSLLDPRRREFEQGPGQDL
jgi:sodium/proline symporter